jgi:hypothetical protein
VRLGEGIGEGVLCPVVAEYRRLLCSIASSVVFYSLLGTLRNGLGLPAELGKMGMMLGTWGYTGARVCPVGGSHSGISPVSLGVFRFVARLYFGMSNPHHRIRCRPIRTFYRGTFVLVGLFGQVLVPVCGCR